MAPASPPWAEVALSVYELHSAGLLNAVTQTVGLGGAYHVGLEVYWLEWSFGWSDRGSGVHVVHVGTSRQGTFKTRVPLGRTPLAPCEVIALLAEMRMAWPGRGYDLCRRNCGHFCAELARRLRVEDIPSWVNSLAATGDWLSKALGTVVGFSAGGELATPQAIASWQGKASALSRKLSSSGSEDDAFMQDTDDSEEEFLDEDLGEHTVETPVPLSALNEPYLVKLELEWRWAKEYVFEHQWQEERRCSTRNLVQVLQKHLLLGRFKRWADAAPPRIRAPRRSSSIEL